MGCRKLSYYNEEVALGDNWKILVDGLEKTVSVLKKVHDYSTFGMLMPGRHENSDQYRYSFQGQEKDDEIKGQGNSYDFGARIYDPRIGRFLSIDPKASDYAYWSPYLFAGNTPILLIDIDGKGPGDVMQGFSAAMADYATLGWTNFRNWTEVKPENATDFNKGLQIADAFMIALATSEIAGGGGMMAGGLVVMEAGVATLIVPGVGEVTFAVAELGGGITAIAGSLIAVQGAIILEMAQENQENQEGFREEEKSKVNDKGSQNANEYDRRVRDLENGKQNVKDIENQLKDAKGPKKREPLQKQLNQEKQSVKTHQKALDQKFPNGRPTGS